MKKQGIFLKNASANLHCMGFYASNPYSNSHSYNSYADLFNQSQASTANNNRFDRGFSLPDSIKLIKVIVAIDVLP